MKTYATTNTVTATAVTGRSSAAQRPLQQPRRGDHTDNALVRVDDRDQRTTRPRHHRGDLDDRVVRVGHRELDRVVRQQIPDRPPGQLVRHPVGELLVYHTRQRRVVLD